MTDYTIDTAPGRLDLDAVHRWLSTDAYWALGRSRETVEQAARVSRNFGAYASDGRQVGYARVVTDGLTFGWVCDVYIEPSARGAGLGVRLADAIVAELRPLGLKRLVLFTRDAHGVYEKAGFRVLSEPGRWMEWAGD